MRNDSPSGAIPLPRAAEPIRHVSLWDFMRLFNPGLLMTVSETATLLTAHTDSSMRDQPVGGDRNGSSIRTNATVQLEEMEAQCVELGLKCSLATCRKLLALLRGDDSAPTFGRLEELQRELVERLRDETKDQLMLALEEKERDRYLRPRAGWESVVERFGRVEGEIEEAGKCLALNRSTATVFHLMRIMEEGLKAVAAAMGIPYAPSWESYLSQIKAKLERKWEDKEPEWRERESFFRDVLAHLQAVKLAWRNPTMHIIRQHTGEQAEEVFNAVRGFMRHLADSLPRVPPSEPQ